MLQNEPPVEANRFYCYPPDKHVIGANALMAGRSLDWFLDQTTDQLQVRSVLFHDMDAFVEKAAPGAAGISFFPYLSGQISPTLNRSRQATFHNSGNTSSQFSRYQAVLEGASFAIAESFDQVTKWTNPPNIISVTGSGANSLVWVQILANILNSDLQVTDAASEGRGAAVFAALAMGEYDSLDQAIKQMVKVSKVVSPDPLKTGIYRELFTKWQRLNEQVAKQET